MPYRQSDWMARLPLYRGTPGPSVNPTFTGYQPCDDVPSNPDAYVNALRQAFAFLRRHGNGRYSASSLMKLLTAADTVEATGSSTPWEGLPYVAIAEAPYTYDEETEVKSGGILAAAVVIDNNKMLLAVNTAARRQKLGMGMVLFARNYLLQNPILWVHRENVTGMSFALSEHVGMKPWEINRQGAVMFAVQLPRGEQEEQVAVAEVADYEIDELVAMQDRRRSQLGLRASRDRLRRAGGSGLEANPFGPEDDPSIIDEAYYAPSRPGQAPRRIVRAEGMEIPHSQLRPQEPPEYVDDDGCEDPFCGDCYGSVGDFRMNGGAYDGWRVRDAYRANRSYVRWLIRRLHASDTTRQAVEEYEEQTNDGADYGWDDHPVPSPPVAEPARVVEDDVLAYPHGYVVNSGRYAGTCIQDIWNQEPDYIDWAANNARGDLRQAAQQFMAMRQGPSNRWVTAMTEARAPLYHATISDNTSGTVTYSAIVQGSTLTGEGDPDLERLLREEDEIEARQRHSEDLF